MGWLITILLGAAIYASGALVVAMALGRGERHTLDADERFIPRKKP